MFPLNQNDPESLRYRILARNTINPTSSALKLAKINKEYRFVNGSDQDPPIFADINKTNGNEKRSLARSLKAYRNSTEHESGGIKRFKNGKRIRYYPLQQQDDLRDGLVKRSSYLHTEGLPIFTEEEYESQFVPVAESTEDDDPAEVALAEDEHTMHQAPPPRNRDRMGNQSSSRNQQASSANRSNDSRSNDSRQARHSSTNHSNNIQPTYRSRDDRSSSPEAERSGYFENKDPSDFLVNKRLGQKVVVDGTPVDFEVEMHLDEDGLFHSGDPWNIVGCYSPRGIETEAGLSVPTLVVIFPNRPLVHDWSMSSTTHTAKITESRDGMIVHLTPGAKDPCMSSLMHQVGRILSTKFSGRVSASTIECLETASESFAAAASEENKNKMTSIHVRFPFKVLPRIHQDAATSDRSLNSLTHHPVFLGNGTAGAPKCLQDSKGRSVNYTKKAAVFTIAVDCKPTKRAKTKAGALSRSEIELLEINEQLAAASLGYGNDDEIETFARSASRSPIRPYSLGSGKNSQRNDDRNMRSSRATISRGGYRDYEDDDEVEVDEGRKLRSGRGTISRGGYRDYEDEEVDEGRKLRSSRVTTSRGGSRGNVHYDEEDGRGTGRTASREAIEDSRNKVGDLIYDDDDDELQGKPVEHVSHRNKLATLATPVSALSDVVIHDGQTVVQEEAGAVPPASAKSSTVKNRLANFFGKED